MRKSDFKIVCFSFYQRHFAFILSPQAGFCYRLPTNHLNSGDFITCQTLERYLCLYVALYNAGSYEMGLANMHKKEKKITPIPLFFSFWTAHKVRALIYIFFFLC